MIVVEALRRALRPHLSLISVDLLLQRHVRSPTAEVRTLSLKERENLADLLVTSIRLFGGANVGSVRTEVRTALQLLGPSDQDNDGVAVSAEIAIRGEVDVSVARSEARRVAASVGVSPSMAVKIATSVSELARNIVLYATTGTIELEAMRERGVPIIRIMARDAGPGIDQPRIDAMFAGKYRSKSGLGKGLLAVKRLANEFVLETALGEGTIVRATFRGAL
jgi:serine/threonine-protein kinase RsbT